MERWFLLCDHSKDSTRDWWAHGKNCSRVPWGDADDDWVRENGFKTRPAAIQAAGGNWVLEHDHEIRLESRDVSETGLRYKIYKCYEIVILDHEGNEVGETNYCYGSKADAEEMAKHELKLAMMKEG